MNLRKGAPRASMALFAAALMPSSTLAQEYSEAPSLAEGGAVRKRSAVGEVPSAAKHHSGGHFHRRCPYARDICHVEIPALREIRPGRLSRCHLAGELDLVGLNNIVQQGQTAS